VLHHLGGHPWLCFYQEASGTHPSLDRAEGMLNRLAPLAHLLRMLVEPVLDGFENVLMLPSGDPSLLAGSAAVFDGAALANIGLVAAQDQSIFLGSEVIGELFAGGTDVNVLLSHVAEVLFADARGTGPADIANRP
jgi:hypothetical protein